MRLDDVMPLAPSVARDGCAVQMRTGTGQGGGTCVEPPVVEVH